MECSPSSCSAVVPPQCEPGGVNAMVGKLQGERMVASMKGMANRIVIFVVQMPVVTVVVVNNPAHFAQHRLHYHQHHPHHHHHHYHPHHYHRRLDLPAVPTFTAATRRSASSARAARAPAPPTTAPRAARTAAATAWVRTALTSHAASPCPPSARCR